MPRRVAAELTAAGHGVSIVETRGPGTAGEIARERIEAGSDLLVAFGGDGTLNELLPGAAHSGVPVAVIPAGTANVLARELGLGTNSMRVARRLAECVPRRIALGRLQCSGDPAARYFALMAGVGFDAHIVYNLNLPLKAKVGQIAYWLSAARQLVRTLDELDVEVNGATHRCTFALASRVRNYAGYLQIARGVSLLDPCFELVLFEGTSAFRYYLKYLVAAAVKSKAKVRGMSFINAQKVSFSAPGSAHVYVQVDGECAGRLPATVEIVPDALTLLMPPGYLKRS